MDAYCLAATGSTYFSSLATVVNVWRSGHNAKSVFKVWCQSYSQKDAQAAVGRLPPRPLRGRWNSATLVEQYLLAASEERLPGVFNAALVQNHATRKPRPEGQPMDDEDEEAYSVKLGRWIVSATKALHHVCCWRCMRVASVSRRPADHMHHFLQKKERRGLAVGGAIGVRQGNRDCQ